MIESGSIERQYVHHLQTLDDQQLQDELLCAARMQERAAERVNSPAYLLWLRVEALIRAEEERRRAYGLADSRREERSGKKSKQSS